MWNKLPVTSLKGMFLAERIALLSMGEIVPDAGFRNCVPFEGSDKRRTPSYIQRHCTGFILQPVVRFTPEKINYSASCSLSKRTRFYVKTKNTIQITNLSKFELWILNMPTFKLQDKDWRCHTHTQGHDCKSQVSVAETCCAGCNLLISSGIAPPYYTHIELRFTRNVGSFVKQYCVVLGLSRFTDKIASPQPCISSLTGFTYACSVRTDKF
jgi:hypothetical protein